MAMRMQGMAVRAKRQKIHGSVLTTVLHPNDVVKFKRQNVAASGIGALIASLKQDQGSHRIWNTCARHRSWM
jgi:hypothetical protein